MALGLDFLEAAEAVEVVVVMAALEMVALEVIMEAAEVVLMI
jgi:hypothetical protein